MRNMFQNCSKLISLPDISKWNTSNVINMACIFYGCSSITKYPDLSKWDTSKVTNLSGMFYQCTSLLSIPDISNWNVQNVNNFTKMFAGYHNVIVDIFMDKNSFKHFVSELNSPKFEEIKKKLKEKVEEDKLKEKK